MQEPFHHGLLLLCGRQDGLVRRELLHTITGGDIADVVAQVGGGSLCPRLDVGTLEYDPGHGASPPFRHTPPLWYSTALSSVTLPLVFFTFWTHRPRRL